MTNYEFYYVSDVSGLVGTQTQLDYSINDKSYDVSLYRNNKLCFHCTRLEPYSEDDFKKFVDYGFNNFMMRRVYND